MGAFVVARGDHPLDRQGQLAEPVGAIDRRMPQEDIQQIVEQSVGRRRGLQVRQQRDPQLFFRDDGH